MQTGAITSYIDVAQVTLYVFWAFFAGLIFYLRREDKREGYPLENDRSDRVRVEGFPPMPAPKTFLLREGGGTYTAPPGLVDHREIRAAPSAPWPGAPLAPLGNPMLDGIGPASYAERDDAPDLTAESENRMVPLRIAEGWAIEERDPDPRGWEVVGADGYVGGEVADVWVDRSEPSIRYLEVETTGGRRVLLPMALSRVDRRQRRIHVESILAHQFADVPPLANPNQVTLREEDRIQAYYGSGHLYATPSRLEAQL